MLSLGFFYIRHSFFKNILKKFWLMFLFLVILFNNYRYHKK